MNKNKNKINSIYKVPIFFIISCFIFGNHSGAYASPITEENVSSLINQERTKRDLLPLKIDPELNTAAKNKSNDMLNRNYFEHYAKGLSPWDFIVMSGYDYLYAGENLAMDFNTSEGMVNAWMNSPLHRENILSPNYSDMGLGIIRGTYSENGTSRDTVMVGNMFGRKKPTIMKIFDSIARTIANMF